MYYTKRSRNCQLTKMTNLCRPRTRHRRRNGTQQAHFESFALGALWTGDEGNCVYSGSITSTSSSSSSSLSFAWWHRSTLQNARTFILKRNEISPHEVFKLHNNIVTVRCKMWQPKSIVDMRKKISNNLHRRVTEQTTYQNERSNKKVARNNICGVSAYKEPTTDVLRKTSDRRLVSSHQKHLLETKQWTSSLSAKK